MRPIPKLLKNSTNKTMELSMRTAGRKFEQTLATEPQAVQQLLEVIAKLYVSCP
jgi:hypothetical protein